jgi:hypothetical protein
MFISKHNHSPASFRRADSRNTCLMYWQAGILVG